MHGVYCWWGGHRIITGIRDHGHGVDSWSKPERFREHPLPRLRGYGGYRVDAPFPTAFLDGVPPAGLGGHRCLIVRPEHLTNTPALISEGDLDLAVRLRDSSAVGRGHKG